MRAVTVGDRLRPKELTQLCSAMAMLEGRCANEAVRNIDDAGPALLESLQAGDGIRGRGRQHRRVLPRQPRHSRDGVRIHTACVGFRRCAAPGGCWRPDAPRRTPCPDGLLPQTRCGPRASRWNSICRFRARRWPPMSPRAAIATYPPRCRPPVPSDPHAGVRSCVLRCAADVARAA